MRSSPELASLAKSFSLWWRLQECRPLTTEGTHNGSSATGERAPTGEARAAMSHPAPEAPAW